MPVECKFENCNKNASFNIASETKVLYCSEHKTNGYCMLSQTPFSFIINFYIF
uniref:Uncharacterized protein n=1 Tax=viral metagenome TaxID=1070528 RepID=A0A6C0D9V5_9ZZZZ